jgi:hypothetical protein
MKSAVRESTLRPRGKKHACNRSIEQILTEVLWHWEAWFAAAGLSKRQWQRQWWWRDGVRVESSCVHCDAHYYGYYGCGCCYHSHLWKGEKYGDTCRGY